jgi:hypothetical protein
MHKTWCTFQSINMSLVKAIHPIGHNCRSEKDKTCDLYLKDEEGNIIKGGLYKEKYKNLYLIEQVFLEKG